MYHCCLAYLDLAGVYDEADAVDRDGSLGDIRCLPGARRGNAQSLLHSRISRAQNILRTTAFLLAIIGTDASMSTRLVGMTHCAWTARN